MHGLVSAKTKMPAVGDAFLVPLGGGTNTFCWVASAYRERTANGDFVVACSSWTGRHPSQLELDGGGVRDAYDEFAAELRRIGKLVLVADAPPPKRWKKLGRVAHPAIDAPPLPGGLTTFPNGTQKRMGSYAGFEGLQRNAQRAWRLARDAAALLSDEAACEAAIAATNDAEDTMLASRLAHRRGAKLGELARLDLLPEWSGSGRSRAAMQKLLVACVHELCVVKTRAAKLAAIARTVERINAWNERHHLIDTPEREALCAVIDDIGHAAGLRGRDLAGPTRDW
jgi:hypothetical protein